MLLSSNNTASAAAVAAVAVSASSSTNGIAHATVTNPPQITPQSNLSVQQSSSQLNGTNGNSSANNVYTPNPSLATPNNVNLVSHAASKLNLQQQITNGLFIRKEIQRFESVHPNIYTVYDLIESIPDFNLQQQLREHIVNIEDSFVNSQEWTVSRNVPDLKLGILGSTNSGKSSLVHRFLTGTYMQEESPEGGRFKKEVIIEGQSYLLLIRDEGGAPEMQFTHWVDAVIFVFSLESEDSFQQAHQYFMKMSHYRNMNDIPFILVGTQDYITETSPRVVDDQRARSLAHELKKCIYYETCAIYGLHVERVFYEACQKVVNQRTQLLVAMANIACAPGNRPGTPSQQQVSASTSSIRLLAGSHMSSTNGASLSATSATTNAASAVAGLNGHAGNSTSNTPQSNTSPQTSQLGANMAFFQANPHLINSAALHSTHPNVQVTPQYTTPFTTPQYSSNSVFKEPQKVQQLQFGADKRTNGRVLHEASNRDNYLQPENNDKHGKDVTPCSTPNQKRKDTNRRRSNLFTPNKKEDKQNKLNDMGIGRSIPIKQGFLYKKTNSTINKDWKKKFVTLNEDGSLRYYQSMNDYMDDSHGKEIDLQKTTIKIPGAYKPRIGKVMQVDPNKLNTDINSLNINSNLQNMNDQNKNGCMEEQSIGQTPQPAQTNGAPVDSTNYLARIDVNSKKRHRRIKSNHKSDQNNPEEQEGFEFVIVSLDNKQWHFEAASNEEREEWVQAIEQQILSSLQLNETNKLKAKNGGFAADNVTILTMKSVLGNNTCADCDAPNPVWASLNLGCLICIECSGIHRNLGTHLSRVRSLELDDWSNELVQVMTSIGNRMINNIYEANYKHLSKVKPLPNSSRDEKEKWIRSKYESKQFIDTLPNKEINVGKQLLDSVSRMDVSGVILCLSHCKHDDVNTCVSQVDKRTSLHIAASQANLVILQLLIWYGANVELLDNQGRNALAYARNSNSAECIQLLIHNGCIENPNFTSLNGNSNNTPASQTSNSTLSRKSHSSTSYIGLHNGLSNFNQVQMPFNVT